MPVMDHEAYDYAWLEAQQQKDAQQTLQLQEQQKDTEVTSAG
jgi:hypothetical protein